MHVRVAQQIYYCILNQNFSGLIIYRILKEYTVCADNSFSLYCLKTLKPILVRSSWLVKISLSVICYTGLCTRLSLSQLDWRSWTVDMLQFFIPERGKHCITDVCCNVVSLAPTFSLYLKQKKKISIPSMIIKGCKISLTSGRTFSENLDNQLFCPILSIYWDA